MNFRLPVFDIVYTRSRPILLEKRIHL